MKLSLQDIKKSCKIVSLQDFDQILPENYLTFFLAKILQEFYILQEIKSSFFGHDLQDLSNV